MLGNFLASFVNLIISALGAALVWVIGLLPTSPFNLTMSGSINNFLSGLAWIIPIGQIIALSQAWLAAVLIYYTYSAIMRWIKVVA
ncbi:MAG: hypothetical protein ACM3X7_14025 [Solirubrobacterales bacterium]